MKVKLNGGPRDGEVVKILPHKMINGPPEWLRVRSIDMEPDEGPEPPIVMYRKYKITDVQTGQSWVEYLYDPNKRDAP